MKTCFLFDYYKLVGVAENGSQRQNHLVVFFAYRNVLLNKDTIQLQFRNYFFSNTMPDRLIVLCLDYNKNDVVELFKEGSTIYEFIPKFQHDKEKENLIIASLGLSGDFSIEVGRLNESDLKEIYNRGMTHIFVENGGLIVSRSAHHFVFPSGKHCDRFLRTGNVLLHGAQITFLASALIHHFKSKNIQYVYCDTSSINSLAYAYINLRIDLGEKRDTSVHVESFGSYSMFEKKAFQGPANSIYLISSSTSGSILRRMTSENKSRSIDLKDIAVIYGLGVESTYSPQVLCDLTKNQTTNPYGLSSFKSYNVKTSGETCKLCEDKSMPIQVEGDVFLLEKPIVSKYLIKRTDLPNYVKSFAGFFRESSEQKSILRTYYKEKGRDNRKYELFFDIESLVEGWISSEIHKPFNRVYTTLEKHVLKSFPTSLKYIVTLSDNSSQILAKLIVQILRQHGSKISDQNILLETELKDKINPGQNGVIAVVSASVVTGRNLLFLSRELRDFEKTYQRMFFTLLNRTSRNDFYEFLESNLSLGEYGPGTHRITNVEKIHCSLESAHTPWHEEEQFIKKLEEFCDENEPQYNKTMEYCRLRIKILTDSGKSRGLDQNLFHPSLQGNNLAINNGFAFAPTDDFAKTATQAEVYFIISTILNELRNKGGLLQTEYVRHVLDPGNFVRYNDGIIQASILRAAKGDELKFHLSEELSLQMKSIIGDMILHLDDSHSEAIFEFFYAIAIKKLRLLDRDLLDCIDLLKSQPVYSEGKTILNGIVDYVSKNILPARNLNYLFEDLPRVKVEEDESLIRMK